MTRNLTGQRQTTVRGYRMYCSKVDRAHILRTNCYFNIKDVFIVHRGVSWER